MEHSDETGLPSSNPSSNSSQLEDTAEPQQEPPKLAYKTLSYHQMKAAAEREAREYMASWPMNDRAAKNIPLHGSIIGLLRDINDPISFNALVVMRKSIEYRMNQVMGAATMYKDFWGIDVPDCHQVNVDAGGWSAEAFRWACRYALFDEPGSLQGHRYVKGSMYMAYCITEAGWDQAEAEAKLDTLVQYKEAGVFGSGISNIEGTSRIRAMIPKIMSTHERPIREELEKIAQYMKLRVQMASSTQSLQEEVPEESSAWPLSGTIQ
ncbi:hypothetical protein VE01_04191 [Pseudogymnoascus verrucosus]|uniref:Uncharacterized protein n=1 Tax=Pseudogymnoascus verrucosus TaxID=342668 RepID=A0A1B8GLH0_9PEZI|nr:uncharacterized protein VE01_04191 [Pseudogymnoascus verrucosus]OBT96684.1 hypothetical protein VE01_04191 [Pseudogymnoascus verrucosus]